MDAITIIPVATVALVRDGHLLIVRKQGTSRFMLPGGKYAAGETPLDCVRREVHEEIGIDLPAESLTLWGTFSADATNEPNWRIEATLFSATTTDTPTPCGEIAEIRWHPIAENDPTLAPLIREVVLPGLRTRGI
ncbi:NUDIX hydrolase [Tuwongella immobilis]|uniref:Nudix hydrolase domain-containing protein n=1 Tax=Tuwongella immobilis TaxID=692036 RepID=A0A6C2YXG1_9BACT|nr:NUDIX domain-containing protein [Tuwongella immobilis]VIP05475.1 dna mismatch repair protein : MutT/NUDIX family protein OS=Nocardioidaceae bacterium Broad-1 GN=NBCG_03324 PE=3 SV=1: NUDIX [Tuwongella immobilis]VTS08306.1 dna mismatch repair protein : MutT/NUDIX family protein OS=Nocardioidaceae bacterium Broad-1 GN=NBCG_03324 PE=3 SV=1: NUDIX [Tuwongella immobilis]